MMANSCRWGSLFPTGSLTFGAPPAAGAVWLPQGHLPFFEPTTWVEICLSLCWIWIVSLCLLIWDYIHEIWCILFIKNNENYFIKHKIKEYILNMIINCSCDRKLCCIKNWNAQWEIGLVHSHESLIFTFVLLLTFKMVPCGHFCIFLTGLKTIMLTKGPLRGGLQKFWWIWRFVGWFCWIWCTIIETRWRFCMFKFDLFRL